MKRTAKKTRWNLLVLLGLAFILSYAGYQYFMSAPAPQSADIFVIAEPLEYGDTTLTGILRKDSAVGKTGKFYLALKDGQTVELSYSKNLDNMISKRVTVMGYLTPKSGAQVYPVMTVSNITLAK